MIIVGYSASDEGEYMGGALSSQPQLLALFPPAPGGVELTSLIPDEEVITMGTAMGGDRRSLRLRPIDAEIIRATAAANPRTVVVIVTAGAVITEEWRDAVPAVLVGWYNGTEGGAALADVLLGAHDATGRLPYSIPTSEEHLPFYDIDAAEITYDRWHGQRLLDRDGIPAAFPLGFGLSYTTFAIEKVVVGEVVDENFQATVTVANTGGRAGRHVVQLYAVIDAEDFPRRVLVGFAPISLEAGAAGTINLTGSTRPIRRWTPDGFVPAAPAVTIEAAAYSGDPAAATASLAVPR